MVQIHTSLSYMDSHGNSGDTQIPTPSVVHATKEDLKCFTSFVYRIKHALSIDGAVCVAQTAGWLEHSDSLSKKTEMKLKRQLLPQTLFALLQIFEKNLSVTYAWCKIPESFHSIRDVFVIKNLSLWGQAPLSAPPVGFSKHQSKNIAFSLVFLRFLVKATTML